MKKDKWKLFLVAMVVSGSLFASDPHADHNHPPVKADKSAPSQDASLKGGAYTAQIKALVCAGCAPLVEKTFRSLKEIGPVHVDTKEHRVHFSVKEGASIKLSAIQSALNQAADQMGMGADFSLSDLKMGPKAQGAKDSDKSLASGYYDANVGGIVCGGCKELIEKTMKAVDGVGAAQVDDKQGTVRFTVMVGKTVSLSKIQSALKTASDQMGMGANYALRDVKPVKKG